MTPAIGKTLRYDTDPWKMIRTLMDDLEIIPDMSLKEAIDLQVRSVSKFPSTTTDMYRLTAGHSSENDLLAGLPIQDCHCLSC